MIYFPKRRVKLFLILLFSLITLNVILDSTKSYSSIEDGNEIINASEMQYQSRLSTLSDSDQNEFINETKIKYIFGLPEKSILLIYIGYFIFATAVVLSLKFQNNEADI